jgi:hypothetical protein
MSSYPKAYCVKCKSHTETVGRHTVVMQNGARALHGTCPKCESEVFKIMPKSKPEKSDEPQERKSSSEVVYPDAFCVKCKTTTPALKGHTVILANDRRALRGVCPNCSSEIYKILPRNKDYSVKVEAKEEKPISLAVTRLSDDKEPVRRWRTVVEGFTVLLVMTILAGSIWYLAK